jgi:PAS domain S-box-containing protein
MMNSSITMLDRLKSLVIARRQGGIISYILSTICIAAVASAQVSLFGSSAPWFLYTPAVVVVALLLGGGAAVWSTILSALGAGYAAARPDLPFLLTPVHWGASIFFIATTLALVGLVVALRTALLQTDMLGRQREKDLTASAEREAFLASVLASSTDCIKVLDLDGRLTFMSEGGKRVMEVSDFNAIAGCPWPDFWQDQGNIEARAAIEAAGRGETHSFVGKAETMAGTPKWWHVAVGPIPDQNGRPARILSVSRDITDLRASEEERDNFKRLAENSTDFIGMADTDGIVFYLNATARHMVGLDSADTSSLEIRDFFTPDQAQFVEETVLPAVANHGSWSGELNFRHFGTGEAIPVLYSVFPIRDAAASLIGYGTVTRDFRDRKRAEEDMQLMNGELAHRLKNVLAVVQSVAQQTLRNATDTRTASQDLSARLVALAAATDVLTQASWRSADLRTLAEQALAPHGRIGEAILINGPSLTLKPEIAVAFALALHELATNAVKYGALSVLGGIVSLRWTIDRSGDDVGFDLVWQESGGPLVTPPERKGFGSTLIERSLRSYFSGRSETDYRPEGLVFRLNARLKDAAIYTGK